MTDVLENQIPDGKQGPYMQNFVAVGWTAIAVNAAGPQWGLYYCCLKDFWNVRFWQN
jgi:hypothetical protein